MQPAAISQRLIHHQIPKSRCAEAKLSDRAAPTTIHSTSVRLDHCTRRTSPDGSIVFHLFASLTSHLKARFAKVPGSEYRDDHGLAKAPHFHDDEGSPSGCSSGHSGLPSVRGILRQAGIALTRKNTRIGPSQCRTPSRSMSQSPNPTRALLPVRRRFFGMTPQPKLKLLFLLISVGDLAAQSLISLHLLEAFPEDKIVGEEDTTELRQNEGLRNKVIQLVNEGFAKGRAEEGAWAEGKTWSEEE